MIEGMTGLEIASSEVAAEHRADRRERLAAAAKLPTIEEVARQLLAEWDRNGLGERLVKAGAVRVATYATDADLLTDQIGALRYVLAERDWAGTQQD